VSPSGKIFLSKLRWFLNEKFSSIWDGLLYGLGVSAQKIVPIEGKKTLVFIGEQLPPRIPRMAKWIKREGTYTPWLICSKKGFIPEFSDPCFEKVLLFRNEWHMKRILKRFLKIDILHGFAPKSYLCNEARKAVKAKYIHDMQDVYSIYYDKTPDLGWMKRELPAEKECLEKADGVVGQSLEPVAAYRKFNAANKPKSLFFPLCCDEDKFRDNDKELSEEFHIVYAGGIAGKHRDPKQYGNTQLHYLADKFAKQKIHFHIYPAPSLQAGDYDEYRSIGQKNKFFHFHDPVPQDKLATELNKYHFGILPFFRSRSEQSDNKLKYASTLKLFNYFEAGIPVIVSKDLGFQGWMTGRFKAGFRIAIEDLDNLSTLVRQVPYREIAGRVVKARKALSIRSAVSRLLNFYSATIT